MSERVAASAPEDGRNETAAENTAHPPRRRHCWVRMVDDVAGVPDLSAALEALVVGWRRTELGWSAQIVYVDPGDGSEQAARLVVAWVPADRLTPVP